jgi:hypothetical protein
MIVFDKKQTLLKGFPKMFTLSTFAQPAHGLTTLEDDHRTRRCSSKMTTMSTLENTNIYIGYSFLSHEDAHHVGSTRAREGPQARWRCAGCGFECPAWCGSEDFQFCVACEKAERCRQRAATLREPEDAAYLTCPDCGRRSCDCDAGLQASFDALIGDTKEDRAA